MNVPAEFVKPLIDQYVEAECISYEQLSELVGYERSTLRVSLEKGELTFRMCDKFLCKMHKFRAWYEEPLVYYYCDGQVPPDPLKAQKCANPKCDEWFELVERKQGGITQRFCSRYCNVQTAKAKYMKTPHARALNRARKRKWNKANREGERIRRNASRAADRERYNAYMRAFRARKRQEVAA